MECSLFPCIPPLRLDIVPFHSQDADNKETNTLGHNESVAEHFPPAMHQKTLVSCTLIYQAAV